MSLTLGTHLHSRGRHASEAPLDSSLYEDLCKVTLNTLNGDWRVQELSHFCYRDQCCGGQQMSVCVDKIIRLMQSLIFSRLGEKLPATNRWHTVMAFCGALFARQPYLNMTQIKKSRTRPR